MNAKKLFLGLLTATVVITPFATFKPASANNNITDSAVTSVHGQKVDTVGGHDSTLLISANKKRETKEVKGGDRTNKRWTLSKKGARFQTLTRAEQTKFDIFKGAIVNRGVKPADAAKEAGDTDYKELAGSKDQFQIRLSQKSRATFRVDSKKHEVQILEVGGHTKTKK